MNFTIKEFNALSTRELFEIYKLRAEVFVVEQNCPYQDVDDKDLSAIHVLMYKDSELAGYSRILPPGLSHKEPSVGRVVVKKELRAKGDGKELVKHCIKLCSELFKDQDIVISAQLYLLKFYNELGFVKEGEDYLEDDIPHVKMRRVQN